MTGIVFDFLKTKLKEKTERALTKAEKEYLHGIADTHGENFIKILRDEVGRLLETQNCNKCDHKEIGTNGSCHICKLCEEYKIADVEKFREFYYRCGTGCDYARVMYYKEFISKEEQKEEQCF